MSRILALTLNTFREAIRNKVLYVLLFFATLLIAFAIVLGQVSLHEEARVTRDLGLGGMALFGVVVAVFIGVNLVYKELDRKTVFALIPKPIERHEFILGKFLGMLLTLAVLMSIMTVVMFVVLYIQDANLSTYTVGPILRAVVLLYLEVMLVTALAVLFSTFTSPFLSGACTLGLFAIGRSLPELRELVGKMGDVAIKRGVLFALSLLPDFSLFYVSGAMVEGETVSVHGNFIPWSYVATSGIYCIGYLTLALILAMLIFRRRDFV